MPAATVSSKGQVTIPKEVRDELGITTGTKVWFISTPHGYVLKAATNSLMALKGALKYDGPPLTLEDMDRAMGEAMYEKYASSASSDAP